MFLFALARLELKIRRGNVQVDEEKSPTTLRYKRRPAHVRKIINKCPLIWNVTKINSEKIITGK
jgi:hypothetical protein